MRTQWVSSPFLKARDIVFRSVYRCVLGVSHRVASRHVVCWRDVYTLLLYCVHRHVRVIMYAAIYARIVTLHHCNTCVCVVVCIAEYIMLCACRHAAAMCVVVCTPLLLEEGTLPLHTTQRICVFGVVLLFCFSQSSTSPIFGYEGVGVGLLCAVSDRGVGVIPPPPAPLSSPSALSDNCNAVIK